MRARTIGLLALGALVFAACEPARNTGETPSAGPASTQPLPAGTESGSTQNPDRPGTRGVILAAPGSLGAEIGIARELWRYAAGAPTTASPAVSTQLVLAGFADFTFRALRTSDGAELWRTTSASLPVSVAITTVGLFAANLDSLIRLSPADGTVTWATPIRIAVGIRILATSRAVYAATADGHLSAVDVETGAVIWSSDLDVTSQAAAVGAIGAASGVLYLCTSDGVVSAVVAADGGTLWSTRLGALLSSGPSVTAGRLIVATEEGVLHTLSLETGEQVQGQAVSELVLTSVVDSGTALFAFGASGGVFRMASSSSGTDVPSPGEPLFPLLRLESDLAGQPSLLDSVILVADASGTLRALDGGTGSELWSVPLQLRAVGEMAYDGKKIYVASASGEIVALVPDLAPDSTSVLSENRLWDIPETGQFRMAARFVTFRFSAEESGVIQWSVDSAAPDDELVVTILDESGSVLATNMGKVALQRSTRVAVYAGRMYQLRVARPHPDAETVVTVSSQRVQ